MKQSKLSIAVKATLLGASIVLAPAAFAADKELLDILKANGSITAEQYTELTMSNMMSKNDRPSDELLKKMAWAGKIKIKGDLRIRNENRSTTNGVSSKGRQRYRARIGVYADVTDNVKAGIRISSGENTTATSTNETADDYFNKDAAGIDLAYINWTVLEGLELMGGKFKQPWQQVSGAMVWDSDLNPEGVAARYTTKVGGANVITSAGLFSLDDNGSSSSEDETISFAQVAGKFKVGGAKTMVGLSVYDFSEGDNNALVIGKGNTSTQYQLTELFGQTEIKMGLPVKLYGHYVKNKDADGVNSSEDTAWLLGVGTKMGNWKASYDYRDVELNSVFAAFNDSDFADGYSDSKGSRWKLAYKINKNFSVATTYLDTDMGSLTSKGKGDVDTWQIDLKAKF
ncbi:MAG: putative porin [Cycloclasticus sp.]|nr:putative porin [Cycloclasticus sp.]